MDANLTKKNMKIVEKTQMNHNTFFFKLESDTEMPHFKSCSHVKIYDDKGNGRPYSPLSGSQKHLYLAIKEYPKGVLSKYICSKNVNDTILVSESMVSRENKPNEFKNVLMIAGGTGITPIYQILNDSFSNDFNITDYTLLFLNKTKDDIFLLPQLEKLKKKSNGKLHIIHVLSQETSPSDSHQVCGKLTKDGLLTITHSKLFEFVYICGPPSLYESFSGKKISRFEQGPLTGILADIGYSEKQVYKL